MIIDISAYQPKVDWNKIKSNSDIEAVYIKSSQGGSIDKEFKNHVIGANAAGVLIGFYHFASLNSADVIADSTNEAKFFYNTTKGINVSLPYALDIETNDIKISPPDVLKWIQNFTLTLHALGINDIILYSYASFLDTNLPKNHQLGLSLPLWIAAYADKYKLPNGWTKAYMWQYTQKGVVDGIPGCVDLSKKV